MLGLFRRARTRIAAPQRRATLRLEALEWRYQLDGTPLSDPPLGDTENTGDSDSETDAIPVIVDFTAEQLANGLYLITGTVVDENPGGLVVTFGGSTSAAGWSITTAADGTFNMIVQLRTDGTDSGFLTATTVDAQGQQSEAAAVFLDPTPA